MACVLCSARWVRHEHAIRVVRARLDPFAADETRRRAGHAVLFDALLDVGAVRIVHDLGDSQATTCYSADSGVMVLEQEGPAERPPALSPLLERLHHVVCRTPRRRLNRLRGTAARGARERRAAEDRQVGHLVRHPPAIDDVHVRIVAHSCAAEGMRAERSRTLRRRPDLRGPGRLEPRHHLLLDVVRQADFVVVEVVRDPQNRPTQRIHHSRIEVEEVVHVGEHLELRADAGDGVRMLGQPRLPARSPTRHARRRRVRSADRFAFHGRAAHTAADEAEARVVEVVCVEVVEGRELPERSAVAVQTLPGEPAGCSG